MVILVPIPLIDEDLFKSLYTESTVELPGDLLHNNIYQLLQPRRRMRGQKRPFDTTTQVFVPSQLYVFYYIRERHGLEH